MILKDLKNSMLFRACEYRKQKVAMDHFKAVNNGDKRKPEADILSFYLGVHILGVAEQKFGVDNELPEDVAALVSKHHAAMEEVFFRIFSYIMLISVGESRHGSTSNKSHEIETQYGTEVKQFASKIDHGARSGARNEYLNQDRDLLQFARYLDWMFTECFSGGSYGGPKWKNISNKITQVLEGEISPFTMTDVAWALVHNTGSIFNKNTIYYSESSNLTQLLDFQRGGAIPSLIENIQKYAVECNHLNVPVDLVAEYHNLVQEANYTLGEDISEYVPPHKIKEAGALSNCFPAAAKVAGADGKAVDNFEKTGVAINLGIAQLPELERKGGSQ